MSNEPKDSQNFCHFLHGRWLYQRHTLYSCTKTSSMKQLICLPSWLKMTRKKSLCTFLLVGVLIITIHCGDIKRKSGDVSLSSNEDQTRVKKMIAPGYYTQECNSQKKCEKGKYCHMFLCVDCLKENVACTQNGQCCVDQGLFCVYGRCKSGASKGAAGTFCDRQSDCKEPETCCVREPAINPAISVCKPALDEHQTCGPYNQYRAVYIGGTVQAACGPCKSDLTCKQVGIFGVHQICLPAKAGK